MSTWDNSPAGRAKREELKAAHAAATSFAAWKDVLAWCKAGKDVYYQAPMSPEPVKLRAASTSGPAPYTYELRARSLRIFPPGSIGRGRMRTADPFTADAGHLDRFRNKPGLSEDVRRQPLAPRVHYEGMTREAVAEAVSGPSMGPAAAVMHEGKVIGYVQQVGPPGVYTWHRTDGDSGITGRGGEAARALVLADFQTSSSHHPQHAVHAPVSGVRFEATHKHLSHGHYLVTDAEASRLALAAGKRVPREGYMLRVALDDGTGRHGDLLRTPTAHHPEHANRRGWRWAVMVSS